MPIPTQPNGGQSALEIAAIAARNQLLPINIYNNAASANEYSATHTRALSDQATPNYGKGTGNFLDIENYAAGSALDINGNPTVAVGGGRNPAFANNLGTWGYAPGHNYQHPNTAGNIGQVIIY
jgi:hypothetical protein